MSNHPAYRGPNKYMYQLIRETEKRLGCHVPFGNHGPYFDVIGRQARCFEHNWPLFIGAPNFEKAQVLQKFILSPQPLHLVPPASSVSDSTAFGQMKVHLEPMAIAIFPNFNVNTRRFGLVHRVVVRQGFFEGMDDLPDLYEDYIGGLYCDLLAWRRDIGGLDESRLTPPTGHTFR